MFDRDPRHDASAILLPEVRAMDESLFAMAGGGGILGRGGMITKVRAARFAARSGCATVIASGSTENILQKLAQGEVLGTLLLPDADRFAARKQWLAGHLQTAGRVFLDAGAVKAIIEQGRSLLPVGVKKVEGQFGRGEVVACVDEAGKQLAVGLSNYSVEEINQIKGLPSNKIASVLGYINDKELIHRDNMALT
jgi:glutamate 5-kinase